MTGGGFTRSLVAMTALAAVALLWPTSWLGVALFAVFVCVALASTHRIP